MKIGQGELLQTKITSYKQKYSHVRWLRGHDDTSIKIYVDDQRVYPEAKIRRLVLDHLREVAQKEVEDKAAELILMGVDDFEDFKP